MRIIAGAARGRRLKTPAGAGTRPATDRVREAVFSSIGPHVEGAAVADLYAGSGAFGLEALSRGAASVVFVERGRKALAALRENVSTLGLGGHVLAGTVGEYLTKAGHQFDLVFLDPPWSQAVGEMEGELAVLDRLLRPHAQIVITRRKGDPAPGPPENWRVAADKAYGDTRLIRYVKDDQDG